MEKIFRSIKFEILPCHAFRPRNENINSVSNLASKTLN